MKVFVVTEADYDYFWVLGVFQNRADAEAFMKEKETPQHAFNIEETNFYPAEDDLLKLLGTNKIGWRFTK